VLQFIFGRPASGKTFTVTNKIKELTNRGKESILIVPEQFTFENEKMILKTLGDKSALFVNVLSFTRLYDEIGKKTGGIAGTLLRDSDKIIFMSRTLKAVKDDLKLWGKYVSSVSFAKTLLDTIGEFKINAITPEDLKIAAEKIKSSSLKAKLNDISLIYENYDALVGEKFIDPADTLTKTYELLKNYNFFEGKTVFIDSFKGFTGQQFKIIERILSQAENVYVSLTDDRETSGEYCIYANIRKAVLKIEKIAKSRNVDISEPIILNNSYYSSCGLSTVERLLAGNKISDDCQPQKESLCICKAQTTYDEAEFVARTIKRLVRTENYRFRDFVIIARDSEKYESAIVSACKKNGVNLFYDSKIPLSAFPISVAGKSALEALNFSTEGILNFHKTGLGTLTTDEISVLENYAIVWNIKGNLWEQEWDMDPRGLTTDDDKDGKIKEELAEINRLRALAIEPIIKFKNSFGKSARQMATAMVELFDFCNCSEKLKKLCSEWNDKGNDFYANAIKQSYDEYMNVLDSLVFCFGEISVTVKEFCDALNLSVSLGSIGRVPQTLDEVTFGAADRIRPSRPKVAFILGANQGVFPKTVTNNGIFALDERKTLIQNEINIADNTIDSSIDENYLVYSNLCCPSEKLCISYCEKTVLGEKMEPSAFVSEIAESMNCSVLNFPDNYKKEEEKTFGECYPQTAASAFGEYCRLIKNDPEIAATVKEALKGTDYYQLAEKIAKANVKRNDTLTKETAQKLYGKEIYMSATKIDTFNRCHFSYFCRYGLNVEKLQTADFNVLQRGTIVHYVLERIISTYKKGVADLSVSKLHELTDYYIEEYLKMVNGFDTIRNSQTDFLIGRISRSLKEVVCHISDEMKQSDFEPVACELKIGKGGTIEPMKFPFDDGSIVLTGSIDRVDEYNGYIR